jgi:hypothetical protein
MHLRCWGWSSNACINRTPLKLTAMLNLMREILSVHGIVQAILALLIAFLEWTSMNEWFVTVVDLSLDDLNIPHSSTISMLVHFELQRLVVLLGLNLTYILLCCPLIIWNESRLHASTLSEFNAKGFQTMYLRSSMYHTLQIMPSSKTIHFVFQCRQWAHT